MLIMKKLLSFLLVAFSAFAAWKKYNEARENRDLWTEVTDSVE